MDAAKGSIRQRGSGSFELRVYGGTDPGSGRRRWLTRCRKPVEFRGHSRNSEVFTSLKHPRYAPSLGSQDRRAGVAAHR